MALKIIKPENTQAVLELFSNVFSKNEPMCLTMHITPDECQEVFQDIITECCSNGLSTMYTHENKIMSVSLNLSYSAYKSMTIENPPPNMIPLLSVLNQLTASKYPNHYEENNVLYLFVLATDKAYMNQGLSKQVLTYSMAIAKQKLFRHCIADATNIISQHILLKHFQFLPFYKLPYDRYSAFRTIAQQYKTTHIIRMAKNL